MTNGQPVSHRSTFPRIDRAAHAQAVEIHGMLARNVPVRDIAAAVGCSLDRVRDVARQPVPVTDDHDDALSAPPTAPQGLAVPTPRVGTEDGSARRTGGQHPAWDTVLAKAARSDDRRITALAGHIKADLATLLALLKVAEQRDQATAQLLAADRRAEAAWRAHDQRHPGRRHTDQPREAAS